MNKRKSRLIKVDEEAHRLSRELSFELSKIEGKRVAQGEVISRAIKNDEIIQRLIFGSKQRRMGLK